MPPRTADNHLIDLKLIINAYCTIGLFETIAAFFAFYEYYFFYGFTGSLLLGNG